MKSTLSLKGWKKLHSDKEGTTMRHSDGHTMRIAHAPLSAKMRGQLAALPEEQPAKMDLGGEIASQIEQVKKSHEVAPEAAGGSGEGEQSSQEGENSVTTANNALAKQKAQSKAGGGEVKDPTDEHLLPGDKTPSKIEKEVVADTEKRAKLADGGDPADAIPPATDTAPAIDTGGDALAKLQQSVGNLESGAQPAAAAPASPLVTQGAPAKGGTPPDLTPDMQEGYNKQQQGIQAEAVAKGVLGANEAKALSGSVKAQADFLQDFQDNHQGLQDEYAKFKDDYAKQHINPNQVLDNMNTGKKISTGIALILGGMGGGVTGQGNPAMSFLQNQINNDINAQIQNVGIKDNLVKFTSQQMGNLRDGAALAKAMQTGLVADQLRLAAAKAINPLAKAQALQAAGQLESSVAPTFQQLAMRKSLMNMNGKQGGAASPEDPASYVPFVVPEAQQKEVFKEIGNAQNAAKNHDAIMGLFEKANDENTIMGRAGRLGFTPPSVKELNALFLPMIHDQEGRVNEYEQATLQDLMPAPGDRASTITEKRKGLQAFMANKLAAPTAKGYGIDLQHFANTSTDQANRLPPQQQAFVKWARDNPNDPRSAPLLKKLGVQ